MDNRQAKQILALYRPGTGDADEPQFAEALELAKRDPELKRWFENHCVQHLALRAKFRQIPVPADLKKNILTRHASLRANIWWQQPAFLGAAAVIVFLAALVIFWPGATRTNNSFSGFRARMARTLVREYPQMDLMTTNLTEIRQFLTKNQAHADYVLPASLEKLPGDGCARLTWLGKKVSMICFDTGGKTNDLYLFVISRSDVTGAPPPGAVQIEKVSKLITASWSRNDETYILAGTGDEQSIRRYF